MGILSKVPKVKVGRRHVATLSAAWRVGDLKLHGQFAGDDVRARTLLAKDTVEFCSELNRKFANDVIALSQHRRELYEATRKSLKEGNLQELQPAPPRGDDWKVSPPPSALDARRVEITGPANDEKMVINMLNSGADACMIDLEDSMAPSAENVLNGHMNIYKAVRGELVHEKLEEDGTRKRYQIGPDQATPMVRVRGFHMKEVHASAAHVGPMPATLFDVGVHLFNNGKYLQERGLGPFLYMPKLHSGVDAAVLEQVLSYCEAELGLDPAGTKVTTLIECLPAAFRTQEIAQALSGRLVGQNCGRWDWLASRSYYLSGLPDYVHPDREHMGMEQSFNKAYSKTVVQTAHQRGFHAMGGMSAFIPVSGDPQQTEAALQKVKVDKDLEIENGHDGAWVAHPAMVEPVLNQFKGKFGDKPHQKDSTKSMNENIKPGALVNLEPELLDPSKRTEKGLRYNLSVALQYMGHYLTGNGAAGINNMMEDLATFEMSRHHIRSWIDSSADMTFSDGSKRPLTWEELEKILDQEMATLKQQAGQLPLSDAREILMRGLKENPEYISRITGEYLNTDIAKGVVIGSRVLRVLNSDDYGGHLKGGQGIEFNPDLARSLVGSRPEVRSGAELVRHRGRFLNRLLDSGSCYKYMGCASGLSAASVVHGGEGLVGPYCGGWQMNAMSLEESRPDTLWVKPEDPGNLAHILNNFLALQDKIQMVDTIHTLQALRSLPKNEFQEGIRKLQTQVNSYADFHDISMLADLEQGYGDVKYTRYAVTKAIENGISVLHIEDQGPKKRCGHLGDKELDTFDHAVQIMTAANYAAQEVLGLDQVKEKLARFCFRTDALSALRIVYSKTIEDPSHTDHPFVDWERGPCPDGRYLWLKKGINPATGNEFGLDQSIARATEMVRRGLADFVWMETPDADIRVAKAFLEGVNENLAKDGQGRQALGLYNFSPSFIWDKNYYPDAQKLAVKVADYVRDTVWPRMASGELTKEAAEGEVHRFLVAEGDQVRGDHLFTENNLERLFCHSLDYTHPEAYWANSFPRAEELLSQLDRGNLRFRLEREANRTKDGGFDPLHHMSNIIVGQRIKHFSTALENIGFKAQLITLPQFHTEAERGFTVARAYRIQGIEGYVQHVQRVEEHLPSGYTYLGHQKAVGTGVEAQLYDNLFSKASSILADSTEQHF